MYLAHLANVCEHKIGWPFSWFCMAPHQPLLKKVSIGSLKMNSGSNILSI
jgi:hypothetical protein